MKREIKFRAWDKTDNSMWEFDLWEIPQLLDKKDIFELMQFTGLKDKNGKEIYEGDIVFETGCGNNVIEWLDKISAFGYKNKTGIRPIPLAFICEVIGNIYENESLLK